MKKMKKKILTLIVAGSLAMSSLGGGFYTVSAAEDEVTMETEAETEMALVQAETEEAAVITAEPETEAASESEAEKETESEKETETEKETEAETEKETEAEVPEVKDGIYKENGAVYGYKNGERLYGFQPVTVEDKVYYYYFQADGSAFKKGVLQFTDEDGKTRYGYFQATGKAYTKGYKIATSYYTLNDQGMAVNSSDGTKCYYYFKSNGMASQSYLRKITYADDSYDYYYFGSNGRAVTDTFRKCKSGEDNYEYFYFESDGKAFKNGLRECTLSDGRSFTYYFKSSGKACKSTLKKVTNSDGSYDYYYFSSYGRAYTERFAKCKTSSGSTYYFYFNKDGKACKDGLKEVTLSDGQQALYYFNKTSGKAKTSAWVTVDGKKYYFGSNGRAVKGDQTIDGEKYYFNEETCVLEWTHRVYQNPSQYYQIQDSITLTGGDYNLSIGFEGLKTRYVIRYLGIGSGIGMNGAYYNSNVANHVKQFQESKGLPVTGEVDLDTWKAMGFTKKQWLTLGAYASPVQVTTSSTKEDCIEAMIRRAYDYLGDDYVIGASGEPGEGVDCSGLCMQGLFAAGIDMTPINPVRHAHPGYEYESANMWTSEKFKHVSYSERQRGDIIIYCNSSGTVIHSAIYLGNNRIIESWPNYVQESSVIDSRHDTIKGVLRVFN